MWVSAREALEALGASPTPSFRIREHDLIYDYARDGLIRSRARVFVRATSEGEERESDAVIPDEFWAVDEHAGFKSDWQSGQFTAKPFDDDSGVQWRALGVEFFKEDVEAIGGKFGPGEIGPRQSRAGRKPRLERWQSFYFAVIEMAQDGRLNKAVFPTQKSLWDDIAITMGDGAWDEDYAEQFVAQIYKKFVGV